ncbi:MAG: lipid A biosynthesis acyltransferase [Gammaproteobacteria bacterium]|nr:MAG: lipid A biosynthesis acyltransferase [Gammaproteobacteria bacterium]
MKGRLARGGLRLLSLLPWALLHRLGHLAGALLFRLDGREARNVRANLAIAYPGLREDERDALARRALIQSAITFCEMPRIWLSHEDLAARVDRNGLPETMRALVAEGKGLILAMPHHGNWEMVSSGIDQSLPITGLYRPPRQAWLEPLMNQGRSVARIRMVPTTPAGIKALHQALKAREVVAILPDQVPKAAGAAAAVAPFFGRECATMVLLGRLAARHGSPVLFVWAHRLENGRYRMEYFRADEEIASADPVAAATALNRHIERCIAADPTQYQWAYRRFVPALPELDNPYR